MVGFWRSCSSVRKEDQNGFGGGGVWGVAGWGGLGGHPSGRRGPPLGNNGPSESSSKLNQNPRFSVWWWMKDLRAKCKGFILINSTDIDEIISWILNTAVPKTVLYRIPSSNLVFQQLNPCSALQFGRVALERHQCHFSFINFDPFRAIFRIILPLFSLIKFSVWEISEHQSWEFFILEVIKFHNLESTNSRTN